MNKILKSTLDFVVRIGISGLLLWWLYTKIDVTQTVEVIKSADMIFLFYGLLTFFMINVVLIWRWFIFIKALDLELSPFQVIRYFFFGLSGNLFLPSAIGGDAIRMVGLCKGHDEKPKVVASILLERLAGFASIVIVAVSAFIFGYSYINDPGLIMPIVLLFPGIILIPLFLFNQKFYKFLIKIFHRFEKLTHNLMKFHDDVNLMKGKVKEGLFAIFLSCCNQLIFACTFFLVAKALNQEIPFIYYILFVPLLCVASSAPSLGGLGAREAGAAYLFSRVGMDEGIAVSISLIIFIYMVIIGVLGGLFYVFTIPSGRVQHTSSDASTS